MSTDAGQEPGWVKQSGDVMVPSRSPLGAAGESLPPEVLDAPGAVLIGLPGAGCSPAIFDRVRRSALSVHAPDWAAWPGPWDIESVADRLAAALARRKGLTLLAGVSLGGVIALLTTLAAPSRVAGLLLSNTGASTAGHGDPDLPRRVRETWTQEESDTFLRSCFHADPDPVLWKHMRDYMARLPREAFLQSIESLRRVDLRGRLPEIRCPTVIAHGRHDGRRRVADAQALAEGIAGAELRLLDAGHTPMVESPEAYAAALDALARRCGVA